MRGDFLTGYARVSFDGPIGHIIAVTCNCGSIGYRAKNVYINDSSVAPTTLRQAEVPGAREWLDGAALRLNIGEGDVELRAWALSSGKEIARGYYRWKER